MIVLQIDNVRDFMNKLLRTELFDHFLLSEATIKGKVSYVIDGHITPEFYTEEELESENLTGLSCLPYGELRESCFSLIKGKKTPLYFKFVFQLSPTNLEKTLSGSQSGLTSADINGAALNIRFQDGILSCTSGVSYRAFSLDHTFDHEWDALIRRFLTNHDISFEEA